uniref:Oxysterol-binding protein-related protein 3A n=1 Tax=Rhizophora mucronata TaxID=61149 RepID=A0A2P2LDN9_RHIMU
MLNCSTIPCCVKMGLAQLFHVRALPVRESLLLYDLTNSSLVSISLFWCPVIL